MNPIVAKVGGLQSQGAEGEAVVNLLQTLGNAGAEVLRLSLRVNNMAKFTPSFEFTRGWIYKQHVLTQFSFKNLIVNNPLPCCLCNNRVNTWPKKYQRPGKAAPVFIGSFPGRLTRPAEMRRIQGSPEG